MNAHLKKRIKHHRWFHIQEFMGVPLAYVVNKETLTKNAKLGIRQRYKYTKKNSKSSVSLNSHSLTAGKITPFSSSTYKHLFDERSTQRCQSIDVHEAIKKRLMRVAKTTNSMHRAVQQIKIKLFWLSTVVMLCLDNEFKGNFHQLLSKCRRYWARIS